MWFLKAFKVIIFISLSFSFLMAKETFVISTIYTKSLNVKVNEYSALARYLENQNKKNLKFDIKLVKSAKEAVTLLNSSIIHIFIDSLYPSKIVQKDTSLRISAKQWVKGKEGYRSIIFVKKYSDIDSLRGLNGKTIAFEDEFSTTAYYVPKKEIENQGLKVRNLSGKNEVNFIFALSEENVAAKVLFSKVDAGAIDEKSYKEIDKDFFKPIYKSNTLPRRLISFSKDVPPDVEKEILELLFNMDKTKEGRDLKKIFFKFSPLSDRDKIIVNEEI